MSALRYMLVLPLLFMVAGPALAQAVGTAAEAKSMLEKVVSDMKANKAKTITTSTAKNITRRICILLRCRGRQIHRARRQQKLSRAKHERPKDSAGKAHWRRLL